MLVPNASIRNQQNQHSTKTRVACIGDSITELSGYPNILQQLLGDSFTVGNFGACGTTILLNSESPYVQCRAYTSAKDFQPDLAIVMLGTNDANPNFDIYYSGFVADYLLLIEVLNVLASKPKVWIVRPPHVFDETWLSGRVLRSIIIPAVDEVAKQAKLPVIDVYSATDNPQLFFDGVHPNDTGAKIIADVIHQTIISIAK
jgi:lysophospholipase L1-like esterase